MVKFVFTQLGNILQYQMFDIRLLHVHTPVTFTYIVCLATHRAFIIVDDKYYMNISFLKILRSTGSFDFGRHYEFYFTNYSHNYFNKMRHNL